MASTRQKKPGNSPRARRVAKAPATNLPRLSDTLLDFAMPLLQAIPGQPTEEFVRAALTLATVAWNLPILKEHGAAGEFAQLRRDLELTLDAAPPAAAAMIDRMMAERRTTHAADPRVITEFKVKLDGDAVELTAHGAMVGGRA